MDQQQRPSLQVPRSVAPVMGQPELAAAWGHQVASRKAEAAKIVALLDYKDRLLAERQGYALPVMTINEAITDAARILGLSQITTRTILDATSYARAYLPTTWEAFTTGLIDLPRLRKIVTACSELDNHTASHLDQTAAIEAAARTPSAFTHWLSRHIAHLDYQAHQRISTAHRRQRHLRVEHLPHGMSFITAYLPTIEAAAIHKRITITARRQHATAKEIRQDSTPQSTRVAEEPPTLAQREVDVFSSWLRTNPTEQTPAPIDAKIMIMIPQDTLTGATDEPAMAADRSWMLPGPQARALATNPEAEHHWYHGHTRTHTADADVDVLSVTYTGRYPPARLRDALIFRDGHCQIPGCTIAAERCDIDHHTPYHTGGKTTATNLTALCRRHHRLKSHGHLLPPPRGDTPRGSSRKL